jgi:regulator of protease activity HflC (stomatin/prohibitin superfamily)
MLIIIFGILAILGVAAAAIKTGLTLTPDEKLSVRPLNFIVAAVVIFGLIAGMAAVGTVDAGRRGVVTRFGDVTGRTLQPGLYFITPFVESVKIMDVQVQAQDFAATASSEDMQNVQINITLNYALDEAAVTTLYEDVGMGFAQRIILPAVQEATKAVTARFQAEELITQRHKVKAEVAEVLAARLQQKGILTDAVNITDIDFNDQFDKAIEDKVTAEQLALKAENDLKRVQFEADQRVEQARAEAEAIRIQAESISKQGGAEYVNLKAIEKWDGTLPKQMLGSTPVPFIQIKEQQ